MTAAFRLADMASRAQGGPYASNHQGLPAAAKFTLQPGAQFIHVKAACLFAENSREQCPHQA